MLTLHADLNVDAGNTGSYLSVAIEELSPGHKMDRSESELCIHQPTLELSSQPLTVTNATVTCTVPVVFKAFSMAQGSWEACHPYGHLGSLCPSWRGRWSHLQWLDQGSGRLAALLVGTSCS